MTDPVSAPSASAPAPDLDAPLNGLEQVIEAALADPAHWRAFEALLVRADLLAVPEGPVRAEVEAAGGGMRVLGPDDAIDLRGVELTDGTVAAALFTDSRRITALWGEATPVIAMNARHLLQRVRDRPVILNPGARRRMLFGVEDVAALLAAADAHLPPEPAEPVRPSGTVRLEAPAREPTALVDRLRAAFAPDPRTGAVWLARAHWTETDRWGWLLDVRSDRPIVEIRAMVARAVTGVSFGDETLDLSLQPPAAPRASD